MPRPHPLELKIPPPVVALLVAVIMWGVSRATVLVETPAMLRNAVAGALTVAGIGFAISGALSFARARTTIHPENPENTTTLVSTGVYRISRNPMYLGLLLILIAWAVWRSAPWALLGPVAFMLYIYRFQIMPEERVLAAKFGAVYGQYIARVRRWV